MGEIVERVTRKNQDLVSELPLTISAQYGLIDQNEFFDKRVASKDVSGYYLIYNGEFAYNKSTSSDAPWGAIKRLDRYENGVLSTLYIVFRIKNEDILNSDFLMNYYDTNNWHKDIQAIASEGARNHGLLNIAPADFFETELMLPQDIEEQKNIGNYFKSLNNLITLHQRKSFLYFSRINDWEQRKLNEVAEFNPKSELPDEFEYVDLESVVGTEMISHRTETKDSAPSRAQRLAQPGDVFFQTVRPYQKNNYLFSKLDNNYVFSTGYAQMRPNIDTAFLMSFLQTDSFVKIVLDNCTGTSYPAINSSDLSNLEISLPKSFEEQKKVGKTIISIDNLITLHQRKCDETKKLKKFMLQKMFPKKDAKKPEIRFAGFTNDWEQRKLNEVAEFNPKSELPDEFEYVDLESVVGTEMISHRTETKDSAPSRAQRLAQPGDVFFQTVRPYQKNNYLFSKLDNNYVFSTGYAQMRPNIDTAFLMSFLQTDSFVKIVLDNCTGTSYPAINSSDLSNLEISLPKSFEEQKKVGKTIISIDNLITLHRRAYYNKKGGLTNVHNDNQQYYAIL